MALKEKPIKAVLFDYGNTLVEFGPKQIMYCDMALANALERHFGPADLTKFREIRQRNRMAPYRRTGAEEYRENDMVEISTSLVRELYGIEPTPEQLADILRTRFEVFVRVVQAPDYVFDLLKKLRKKYRLGLLSNYPDGNAIRKTLTQTGLEGYFQEVVVSADVGVVKPHPTPFITILDRLRVRADETVLVGDNWLADVQGGKRAGLRVILTRQWECPEEQTQNPDDSQPDATISHLTELESLLL